MPSELNTPKLTVNNEATFRKSLEAAFTDFSPPFWKAARICATFGAVGIFSGFALFILIWEKQEDPWKFVLSVGFGAGGLACFIEWAKGRIEREGGKPWSWSKVVINTALIATFELFIIAGHTLVEMEPAKLKSVALVVLGGKLWEEGAAIWELIACITIWLVVGMAMTVAMIGLIRLVINISGKGYQQYSWPAAAGALLGVVAAPICTLVGFVVVRIVRSLVWSVEYPTSWLTNILTYCEKDKRYFNDAPIVRIVPTLPLQLFCSSWNTTFVGLPLSLWSWAVYWR